MTQATLMRRRIAARRDIVFDALVTAEGIGSWWGPDDLPVLSARSDPRVGGEFEVSFRTKDGLEHTCAGEFLEITRPEHLVRAGAGSPAASTTRKAGSRASSSGCARLTPVRSSRSSTPSSPMKRPRSAMKVAGAVPSTS